MDHCVSKSIDAKIALAFQKKIAKSDIIHFISD